MERVGAIVVARVDSSRLPGKALKEIHGKPLVHYVLERAQRVRGIDRVILATSDRAVDDVLAAYGEGIGVPVFRGSAEDVAGRVLACVRHFDFDGFIRVCGDSPLMDQELLSKGLEILRSGGHDIVTNRVPRSYPVGMSMEIFRTDIFSKGYREMTTPEHFEHVTAYFYENASKYKIYNVESGNRSYAGISLAVDTPEDVEKFRWLLEKMGPDYLKFNVFELIDLYMEYHKSRERKAE